MTLSCGWIVAEGVLQATIDGLQQEQDFRREVNPEVAAQVRGRRKGKERTC
jgi:hypothetical protein